MLNTIKFRVLDSIYPPNTISWMGASLLGSLNSEIERFSVLKHEYETRGKIPDRFGECFLLPVRQDVPEEEIV